MAITQLKPQEPEESPWTFGLGDRLHKALRVAGVSNADMADYLGVSPNTIGNYTSGRTEVKMQTLRLWAMRTGAPLEWLETGIERPVNDPKPIVTAAITNLADWRVQRHAS